MDKFCQSCGMPIQGQAPGLYCQYCTDEKGNLKSREVVREGIAAWLTMFTPNPDSVDMKARAESYMNAMPAWEGSDDLFAGCEISQPIIIFEKQALDYLMFGACSY